MSGRRSSGKQPQQRRSSWGRRKQSKDRQRRQERDSSYVPPPSSSAHYIPQPPSSQPPTKASLTSSISTLFRRADKSQRTSSAAGAAATSSQVSSVADDSAITPSASIASPPSTSRLFYSDTGDDSDDSYESRISSTSQTNNKDNDDNDNASVSSTIIMEPPKTIVRYRGFSTSLSSLFLDEPLVCASMGCFGLLLSNRTEYLLSLRQEKRGMRKTRKVGNPSKLMAYTLLLTLILIASTFCIWGFGNGKQDAVLQDYYDGYNNNDDNDQNDDNNNAEDDAVDNRFLSMTRRNYALNGVFKIRDYHEHVWQPIWSLAKDEWNREDDDENQIGRKLDENGYNQGDDDATTQDYNATTRGRNIGSDTRMALGLAFLVFLGIVGRKRRMRTRYALIRARAQEDYLYYASASQVTLHNTREDQFDGACSHTLCGCYPVDPTVPVPEDEVEEHRGKQKKKRHGDCVSRGFSMFLACCCGVICKCWFQCLSVCALAQEAREMRLLLPPRFQRIDFITHQPFIEYQKDVNDLRRGWMGKTRRKAGIMPHFFALSRLSRYILMGFSGVLVVILLTLLFNPRAAFSIPDAIVLLATFGQSFLVLYVVHWIFHKSDLSLDAVIKFFATGFLIATPAAFFFEGLIVNVILVLSYSFYSLLVWLEGDAFVNFVFDYWRFIWIFGELINAYLVAAVTEELCKYYSFRAVEHPDLVFLTGLDRQANDSNAVDGGHIKYSFSSHQVSELNRTNSFGSVASYRSQASSLSRNEYPSDGILRTTTEEEFYEDENDARTYRQKAAAVTTGMIGVAVGLACAENFLYVFVLGGAQDSDDGRSGGVLEEWIVLLFRSVFPIHALAAAMQSINMIRKFVECTDDNNHRIGVGRIILPAVILHGSFDAILMSINVFIESSWDTYLEENDGNEGNGTPYNPLVVNLVAWASIIFIMVMGLLWYYRENRSQRLRLILLEERDKAKEEGGASKNIYESPSSSTADRSEVELV